MARRCPQLHLAGAIAVVTFLTLDGFAAAQDPAGRFGRVVPLEGAAQTKAGVELLHDQDRRVDRVRWGRSELRLSRPVHTCKVGTAAGGRLLVILAGGVHAELSLYLASGDGELRRYSTGGGRLLSRAFNGAASFWPAVEGRHLVLFGFARNADQNPDVELRALDFDAPGGVRVLASRRLPPTASGWTVRHDRDDGLVRIDIDGVKDPTQRQLEFRHPLAPVLRASSGQLQFGEHRPGTQTRRDLWLENPGSRPVKGLRLEQPLPTGFELAGSMPDTLAPGAKHTLAVRFAPRGPGTFRGPLRLTAEGGRPIAPVELIGSAVVESRRAAPAPVAPPAPVVQ
ncbi:MAG: hypothetical protein KDC87_06705, partial [Planctomycetes bacterium]|nr:hypothetical protein [Planctomycetota bacterium]